MPEFGMEETNQTQLNQFSEFSLVGVGAKPNHETLTIYHSMAWAAQLGLNLEKPEEWSGIG